MTKKDKILNAMLSHHLIKEKYDFDNSSNDLLVIGPSTDCRMVEIIRTMVKSVEIQNCSKEEVASTLLKTLND